MTDHFQTLHEHLFYGYIVHCMVILTQNVIISLTHINNNLWLRNSFNPSRLKKYLVFGSMESMGSMLCITQPVYKYAYGDGDLQLSD